MRHALRLVLAFVLLVPVASADDPTPLLPESALAYLELDGLAELPAKLGELSIWKDGTAFTRGWNLVRTSVREALLEMKEDAPVSWEALEAMAGQLRRLRLCLLDVPANGEPSLFVMLEMGSTADVVRALEGPLAKLVRSRFEVDGKAVLELELDRQHIYVHVGATALVASLDQRTMRDYLAGRAPARPLADCPQLKAVRARYGDRPMWAYVNLARCLDAITAALGRGDRRDFDRIDGVLDLRGLRSIGLGSSLEQSTSGRALEVSLPIPAKHAAYAALRGTPLDLSVLKLLPGNPALVRLAASFAKPEESWAAMAGVLHQLERAFGDDDLERAEADLARELGSSVGELLGTLGGTQFLEISEDTDGRDHFLWGASVRNREALDARIARMKAAPFLTTHAERIRSATHRGAALEFLDDPHDPLTLVRTEDAVLFASSPAHARTALDQREVSASAYHKLKLDQLAPGHTKLVLLDPRALADEERDMYFAGQLVAPDVSWILGTEEHDDRLVVGSNLSAQSIVAGLALSAYLWDQSYRSAHDCEERLAAVGQAIEAFRERNHRNPATLAELGMDEAAVRCPHAREGGAPGDYAYLALGGEGRYLCWCPLTDHGRIVLANEGGGAERCRERTFERYLARMRADLAAGSGSGSGSGSER